MPSRPLRVLVLGLGPIGRAVSREIAAATDLDLAGTVDPAPGLAGRDLGRLLRVPRLRGSTIATSLEEIRGRRPDVCAHLSASSFPRAAEQVREVVRRRIPVASTCEEMIAARERWPREASALDRAARRARIAVLATGINPGFVMDLLPAALSNVCVGVKRVRVERWVDTATRRRALQEKTGLGLPRAEFRKRARAGTIGHVGLRDSLLFLMKHLPLEGDVGEERIRAILAEKNLRIRGGSVRAGEVLGVHQTVSARSSRTGRPVVTFDLRMALGLGDAHDEIRIEGDPSFRVRIDGGIPGDRATVGAVLSTLRYLPDAPPGLGV